MSIVVRDLLKELGLYHLTTHEDRVEIDREIERITGKDCDEGAKELTREEFIEIVRKVLNRKKKKKREEIIVYA
ncbi:MAG: hypothetical protein ACXQTS_06690 [Candidatus Methanospirareceae archaeon]